MVENAYEKQIAIKLNEKHISRLDNLAKRGNTNRSQLMVSFIRVWLNELRESTSAMYFHLAIILKEVKAEIDGDRARKTEFVESSFPEPEKPFPIKLNEDDALYLVFCTGSANMTRHHMMKKMIITGIEELEELTGGKEFDYSNVEPELKKKFGIIMAKGFMAYTEGIKEKRPLKRKNRD